jgi:hypothetical protein
MTAKILSLTVFALALGVVVAGPTGGTIHRNNQVENEGVLVPSMQVEGVPGENDEFVIECRANQRTSILIRGDHDPVGELEVLVYESPADGSKQGKLVAQGSGTLDLVGAVWVPQRTEKYRIVIRNSAPFSNRNRFNVCYVTIK